MRTRLLFLAVMALMMMGLLPTAAQEGYPVGYETVYIAPESGMHPLNYSCTLTVHEISNGVFVPVIVTATVDAYIIWRIPKRPAYYHVTYSLHGIALWNLYSQETLDAICPKAASAQSIVKRETKKWLVQIKAISSGWG